MHNNYNDDEFNGNQEKSLKIIENLPEYNSYEYINTFFPIDKERFLEKKEEMDLLCFNYHIIEDVIQSIKYEKIKLEQLEQLEKTEKVLKEINLYKSKFNNINNYIDEYLDLNKDDYKNYEYIKIFKDLKNLNEIENLNKLEKTLKIIGKRIVKLQYYI